MTGVLDFGCAGLGDPAGDAGILLHIYGEEFMERMRGSYPGLEGLIDRSRFGVSTAELRWAAIGVKFNDYKWFMYHLSAARDVKPVGSRFG